MKKLFKFFRLSKREQFVIFVVLLSLGVLASEYFFGLILVAIAFGLSFLTTFLLYLSLRRDVNGTFFYPILILPFFYTFSFVLFYPLVPARTLTKIIMTTTYAFGLYSLFLTQNIFAVSTIRTINLLRSARIVSFVITIVVLFLMSSVVFSLTLPVYISPIIIFVIIFFLNIQSLWTYSLSRETFLQLAKFSFLISLCIAELSLVLSFWPIDGPIYSIFVTGIFYAYSGLIHAWVEKRLFKGVLWEYIWVGFLAVLILIVFSKWGI